MAVYLSKTPLTLSALTARSKRSQASSEIVVKLGLPIAGLSPSHASFVGGGGGDDGGGGTVGDGGGGLVGAGGGGTVDADGGGCVGAGGEGRVEAGG